MKCNTYSITQTLTDPITIAQAFVWPPERTKTFGWTLLLVFYEHGVLHHEVDCIFHFMEDRKNGILLMPSPENTSGCALLIRFCVFKGFMTNTQPPPETSSCCFIRLTCYVLVQHYISYWLTVHSVTQQSIQWLMNHPNLPVKKTE